MLDCYLQLLCTYSVQVQVWDGLDEHGNTEDLDVDGYVDDIIKVTITVNDRPESPAAPVVMVTSPEVAEDETIAMLTVTWYAPENMSHGASHHQLRGGVQRRWHYNIQPVSSAASWSDSWPTTW